MIAENDAVSSSAWLDSTILGTVFPVAAGLGNVSRALAKQMRLYWFSSEQQAFKLRKADRLGSQLQPFNTASLNQ